MKHIKGFSIFEAKVNAAPVLTSKEKLIMGRIVLGSYSQDPSTGVINVEGDVNMSDGYGKVVSTSTRVRRFNNIPFQFGEVTGHFLVAEQRIASIKGSPSKVGLSYDCGGNGLLMDIKDAPREIGEDFDCSINQITTLKGGPIKVGRNYDCSFNQLTKLTGAPEEILGDFNCRENSLRSLEGAPRIVHGNFDFTYNPVKNLRGSPRKVGGDFIFEYNELIPEINVGKRKLSSLEGAPDEIGGWFIYRDDLKIRWNLQGWIEGLKKYPDLFDPFIISKYGSDLDLKDITPSDFYLLRTHHPAIWQKLQKDQDSVTTLADLGEIGF
jgi:hypothetical protein